MRRLLLQLLVLASALSGARQAGADTHLMILEQASDGSARHEALDESFAGDSLDPVNQHILLNKPTDPATAQVLWVASDEPVVWRVGEDDNTFKFVEHAVLPDGARIDYRVFLHRADTELLWTRHSRVAGSDSYAVDSTVLDRLPPLDEYKIEAHLIVPDRPTQVLIQRLNVINDGQPDPEPNPNPNPVPNPGPNPPGNGGVPPLADGFTPLVQSPETRIIYVSDSEGNDANDGRTPQTAVKTLARGSELVRTGRPDWLLLKAGDAWVRQSFDGVMFGGAGGDKPMVIGVYGEGRRPIIVPPDGKHGLSTRNQNIRGLVIQGLHFYGATRDPASPIYAGRPGDVDGINIRTNSAGGKFIEDLVIEDCIISYFDSNIKIVDDWSRLQGEAKPGRIQALIRRNVIRYATSDDSHSVGIYIEGSRDTIIEQNLIDHNGWGPTDGVQKRNKRSHNIYAQWANGPIAVRYNVISRGAAHGLQLRGGGNIEHNLFVRNAMAFYTTLSDSKANYNIILESDDMDPDEPGDWRGYGINGWNMDRYEVIGNIVARRVGTLQKAGIEVSARNLVIQDNTVYDWTDKRINASILYSASENETVSGNRAKELNGGVEPNYRDPDRGPASFAEAIGLDGTLEAYLDFSASRPRGQWENEYRPSVLNGYIRAGFEIVP